MKINTKVVGLFTGLFTFVLALMIACTPVLAQSGGSGSGGGSGGGGSARKGGRFGMTWTSQLENGRMPVVSGTCSITTYVTMMSVDISVGQLEFPDGTQLIVTAYANSYFTGLPVPPQVAGVMTLVGKKAKLSSLALWTSSPGQLPYLTSVVITDLDGNVISVGTP